MRGSVRARGRGGKRSNVVAEDWFARPPQPRRASSRLQSPAPKVSLSSTICVHCTRPHARASLRCRRAAVPARDRPAWYPLLNTPPAQPPLTNHAPITRPHLHAILVGHIARRMRGHVGLCVRSIVVHAVANSTTAFSPSASAHPSILLLSNPTLNMTSARRHRLRWPRRTSSSRRRGCSATRARTRAPRSPPSRRTCSWTNNAGARHCGGRTEAAPAAQHAPHGGGPNAMEGPIAFAQKRTPIWVAPAKL